MIMKSDVLSSAQHKNSQREAQPVRLSEHSMAGGLELGGGLGLWGGPEFGGQGPSGPLWGPREVWNPWEAWDPPRVQNL